MDTKALAFAIVGFLVGGLVVSIAATQLEAGPNDSMEEMTSHLKSMSGDDYDRAFIDEMIRHHQSALDMARLSAERAKHPEIKQISQEIIADQQAELVLLKDWQTQWGYPTEAMNH